jgi:hypothetical protein
VRCCITFGTFGSSHRKLWNSPGDGGKKFHAVVCFQIAAQFSESWVDHAKGGSINACASFEARCTGLERIWVHFA